jgi:hypothetical protein
VSRRQENDNIKIAGKSIVNVAELKYLGKSLINYNYIPEEIKGLIN